METPAVAAAAARADDTAVLMPVPPPRLEPVPPPKAPPARPEVAAGAPAPTSFPRTDEPLQRQVAAATAGAGATTAAAPSRGREVMSTIFVMITLFALTWAIISFFYGHMDLAAQSGAGVLVGLVLFGAVYLTGRKA